MDDLWLQIARVILGVVEKIKETGERVIGCAKEILPELGQRSERLRPLRSKRPSDLRRDPIVWVPAGRRCWAGIEA
jgi:hypothetical protein